MFVEIRIDAGRRGFVVSVADFQGVVRKLKQWTPAEVHAHCEKVKGE